MNKPRILVVGSSNTDMTIALDRIPRPGETVLGGDFSTAGGGKGANQAVAAARAGGEIYFVGRVGSDIFGDRAVAQLVAEGINVEHVVRDQAVPSGVAMVLLAKDGENSIAVAGGANGRLSPADVKKTERAIAGSSLVLVQLETPLESVEVAAELAAGAGVPLILNPAPARPLPQKLLKLVSILTPNETECELLTGIAVTDESSAAQAAERLRGQGVGTVILTLGARGVFVATAGASRLIPGFRVKVVDTTGAGDVFNGALAVALGEGRPLLEAAYFANAAAALSVTRLGAQPSAPRRQEIEALLASNPAGLLTSAAAPRDTSSKTPDRVQKLSPDGLRTGAQLSSNPGTQPTV